MGSVFVDLTFLTLVNGGRKSPPRPPWGVYAPHVVIEGQSEYLGVRFVTGPAVVSPGEPARFELVLMYPEVDYSSLQPGVAITIREGSKSVARGRVLERK